MMTIRRWWSNRRTGMKTPRPRFEARAGRLLRGKNLRTSGEGEAQGLRDSLPPRLFPSCGGDVRGQPEKEQRTGEPQRGPVFRRPVHETDVGFAA